VVTVVVKKFQIAAAVIGFTVADLIAAAIGEEIRQFRPGWVVLKYWFQLMDGSKFRAV